MMFKPSGARLETRGSSKLRSDQNVQNPDFAGQFAGLLDGDRIPDSKTIWLFRDTLAQAEVIQPLFKIFGKALENLGLIAQGVDRSASAARSRVRAHVEHVFAAGKNWGKRIQIRTIGQARANLL